MDDSFEVFERKKVHEINIASILDSLVVVIFFLLVSTSFVQFTKLSVPPSGVTTITDPVKPPPLQPKFMGTNATNGLHLILAWGGNQPGQINREVTFLGDELKDRTQIFEETRSMVVQFNSQFPQEQTLQIGLAPDVYYQNLIAIMDGIIEVIPDVVLFSYAEVQARANGLKN